MPKIKDPTRELGDIASLDVNKPGKSETILSRVGCCFISNDIENDQKNYYMSYEDSQHVFSTRTEIIQSINEEFGLTENHFSPPEDFIEFSTSEELKTAIVRCKEIILSSGEDHDRKKQLVAKLIQLKWKLQEITDAPEEPLTDVKIVLGHHFEVRSLERPHQYCEKCCGIIWGVITNWYHCIHCGFKCHAKCLNLITRTCAYLKISENASYELSICPISGLSQQKFRCAECRRKFMFKNDHCVPRLCDYTGLYYCSHCHWNSRSVTPARVVHNWDFTPQKVCRGSLQFLRLMVRKPVLNLESLNPTLFALVTDLGDVKRLRTDLLTMKRYLLSCHSALQEERLLLQLSERQHFVEGAHMYSLQDLLDAASGDLRPFLEHVRSLFLEHITQRCQGCRGKGFICELCKSDDVIFPFDPRTELCGSCSSVFHQDCYLRWEGPCPKCVRRKKTSTGAIQ